MKSLFDRSFVMTIRRNVRSCWQHLAEYLESVCDSDSLILENTSIQLCITKIKPIPSNYECFKSKDGPNN